MGVSESFAKGQRWISSTEPTLGLGLIAKIGATRVSVEFPAADKFRLYALESSPLRRVKFRIGEEIETRDGRKFAVEEIQEIQGVLVYSGDGVEIPETELSDILTFSAPLDRLLGGQMDEPSAFALRFETLRQRAKWLSSPVRGFIGARMDLIPHQLYVAHEAASRYHPRILLADEVGLGKTIEAGLILHRLILSNRVKRALIIVPEPLVHQWFIELWRRFNIKPHIFDEERCVAIDEEMKRAKVKQSEANPFFQSQVVLCSLAFFLEHKKRQTQALKGEWDILVIDEAHHLEWDEKKPSPAYTLAAKLTAAIERVLLLTGTPEQVGPEDHFARLRLLDPNRYGDLGAFLKSRRNYKQIATLAQRLSSDAKLTATDTRKIKSLFKHYTKQEITGLIKDATAGDETARQTLLADLVDQHGPGRVFFRNRRTHMDGFPDRKANLIALEATEENPDPVLDWLVKFALSLFETGDKTLLITRSKERVEELKLAISKEVNLNMAVFHEDLTLLQRDRNAAWFAEEEGAQLLLCSEIGSEGRNFQFAHHLILLDLPENPFLLEQRIGRLDRIGQTESIRIDVPYVEGTSGEVLARWYHEGLNAFEQCLHGGDASRREFGTELARLDKAADAGKLDKKKLASLVERTRTHHDERVKALESGRDVLLEMTSCHPATAAQLADGIREFDEDPVFERYFVGLMDHFGVSVEPYGDKVYFLKPDNLYADSFPEIPSSGMTVTVDRKLALSREDYQFVTWDHPLVQAGADLLLASGEGNASFGFVEIDEEKMLFLEAVFVLECISSGDLHVERFFPPTPLRALVNHRNQDLGDILEFEDVEGCFRPGKARWLQKNHHTLQKILPELRKLCEKAVQRESGLAKRRFGDALRRVMSRELERLEHLEKVNDHVDHHEVEALAEEIEAMKAVIGKSRMRLDSLRVLFKEDD